MFIPNFTNFRIWTDEMLHKSATEIYILLLFVAKRR